MLRECYGRKCFLVREWIFDSSLNDDWEILFELSVIDKGR